MIISAGLKGKFQPFDNDAAQLPATKYGVAQSCSADRVHLANRRPVSLCLNGLTSGSPNNVIALLPRHCDEQGTRKVEIASKLTHIGRDESMAKR